MEIGHRLETNVVDEQSTNKVLEQDSFRESFHQPEQAPKTYNRETCLKNFSFEGEWLHCEIKGFEFAGIFSAVCSH